jgi:RNA polymerase sigma-70 factor (ECF subfamily)
MRIPFRRPPENSEGARLAAEMRPALVRYFRRKSGNPAEAEDLAQDVLTHAFGQALRASAAEVKGYIFRAAANRWNDRLRRTLTRGSAVTWDEEISGLPSEQITPERVLSAEQELHQVTEAFLELDERTRNVLLLVRLEHLKVDTVAQMLGISRAAVNRLLAKGLAHVRSKDGGAS